MKSRAKAILLRALPFVLVAAVLLGTAFFPHAAAEETAPQRVVLLWNIDTFEGGKGSRTAFLRKVARKAEKGGVFYLVTDYTAEGAEAAFAAGQRPDLLSFGVGFSAAAEFCLPLPYSFAGGETDEGCLAYPWCRGDYLLFSLTDDFTAAGETAISVGGRNLPAVAARIAGIGGTEAESLEAYTGFLSGRYRYLLGTQRDRCRFAARGTSVCEKPLGGYCDLYQYVSVLSAEKRADCLAFLEVLLSAETQASLGDIGMRSAAGDGGLRTVNVFAGAQALAELGSAAARDGEVKNLYKFLKTV